MGRGGSTRGRVEAALSKDHLDRSSRRGCDQHRSGRPALPSHRLPLDPSIPGEGRSWCVTRQPTRMVIGEDGRVFRINAREDLGAVLAVED